MTHSKRSSKGQFKKGTSGNPTGRPAGSRNKASLLVEQLLEDDAEALGRKVIEMAKEGNTHALRLALERIVPPRKERTIELDLRPVSSAQDLRLQHHDIVTAIAEGRITPTEGESLANILVCHAQLNTAAELERRIAVLEDSREEARRLRLEQEPYDTNNQAHQRLGRPE
jgi:hypothetical protein